MIKSLTDHIKYNSECYLYWIHKKDHCDMFSEGYIGITINPKIRLQTHNRCLNDLENSINSGYSKIFRSDFNNFDLFFEVIDCGSVNDMQQKEYLLRPTMNIGYNVAVGGFVNGVCARYKNGCSSDVKNYTRFKKLLRYCISKNIYVDYNFKTDDGFKLFLLHIKNDMDKSDTKCSVTLIDKDKGFSVNNFEIVKMRRSSSYDDWVYFNDRWWTKTEACEFNGVNRKTVDKRLIKYKMTREEAVGFVKFKPKNYEIVYLNGTPCKYNTKLSSYSIEQLKEMYDCYESGNRGFYKLCKKFGTNSTNMVRFFKRYGLDTKQDRRFKYFQNNP